MRAENPFLDFRGRSLPLHRDRYDYYLLLRRVYTCDCRHGRFNSQFPSISDYKPGRSMPDTLIVRKSWVTYLRPLLGIVLYGIFALVYVYFWSDINAFFIGSSGDTQSGTIGFFMALPLIGFVIGTLSDIWQVCLNRSVMISIGPGGVAYRSGILPWKREESHWRYHQIYRAMYVNQPQFLGWLLRFGDLVIVGREGSTREYRIGGLHNPKRAQLLISSRTEA